MAKLKKLVICCLFASVFGAISTQSACANDRSGFQYWSTADFVVDINKDWKTAYQQEFRFGDDGGHLYYHHSDIGLIYKGLAKWIDVGINFRKVFLEDDDNDWGGENRPHINVTLKKTIAGIAISMRNRIEYRHVQTVSNFWRYRNKVTFKFPWELTPLKLKPYVADEIFINAMEDEYVANRLYAGATFTLFKNINTSLYYVWQSARASPGRNDIHAFGTKLVFNF